MKINFRAFKRIVSVIAVVLACVCGCREQHENTYHPDGKIRDAVRDLMGKCFDARYCSCSWQCQTNGLLDIRSGNFKGSELPMLGTSTIHVTPTSRMCYQIDNWQILDDTNELAKVWQEILLIANLTNKYPVEMTKLTVCSDDGLRIELDAEDFVYGTSSNDVTNVWFDVRIVNTNLQHVAYEESQNKQRRIAGLETMGFRTGQKVDVSNGRFVNSRYSFVVSSTNDLYGHTCSSCCAWATPISNVVHMAFAEAEMKPNMLTNVSERLIADYEKKYFPNRFICVQSNTNSTRWIMPFFNIGKVQEGYCQKVTVLLTKDACGIGVYDDEIDTQSRREYKIYKAQKREADLAEEAKKFQIDELFGVGLGWYQLEDEKLDSKTTSKGDDGEIEYCNNCLNPDSYKRYFGIGLTGYAVKKRSRRVCVLCGESNLMGKESAKSKSKEIADDLSRKIGVAGECSIKGDDWCWEWNWTDTDSHPMRIRLYADCRDYGQYKLEFYINDMQLRNVKSYDEFVTPSGIVLGTSGAIDRLGCVVATEPNAVRNGISHYDVLPSRKGLYLAELPISSIAIDSNDCAVAVSYAFTNELTDAELQDTLKTVRLFVENSLWTIGSEDHFRFGAEKGISSYYWILDSDKPKGNVGVFLHGGKSETHPPIALDIFWLGESQPQQRSYYEDECPSDLFATTRQAIVFITGQKTTGSGFIVRNGGKCYVYTNRHVVDHGAVVVKDIQGNSLKIIGRENAIGLDISRLELQDIRNGLEFSPMLPSIGDAITVIGDSDGVGAATKLEGKVIAVGPKILELDAKFIPGNSGSPVLRPDGKVIGIATFGYDGYNPSDRFKSGTRFNGVRRFALRVPADLKWREVW